MDKTFDLSQVPTTALTNSVWWEEISARGLRHVTNFGWPTEKRANIEEDFPGIEVIASHVSMYQSDYLIWLDNCLIAVFWSRDELNLILASKTRDFKHIEEKFRAVYPLTEQGEEDERIGLKFWFIAPNGQASGYSRLLDVPAWEDITENYGADVRDEMARLTAPDFRPSHGGQLMLWQGPPGTGKTFAIRALIRSWVKWCDGAYIVDPDQFFHNANYMMQVMLDEGGQTNFFDPEEEEGAEDAVRWKLIILEDSGELLSADAKQRTGQALSRLLNIADGLIGQGLKVLILITTNEEMASLHDAVSRPGRCASKIVFPRLSKVEANEWLTKRELATTDKDMSLAELYGEQEGFAKKAEKTQPWQNEIGFAVPKKDERRAIGFATGNPAPSPAPEVGPAVEGEDDGFIPTKDS